MHSTEEKVEYRANNKETNIASECRHPHTYPRLFAYANIHTSRRTSLMRILLGAHRLHKQTSPGAPRWHKHTSRRLAQSKKCNFRRASLTQTHILRRVSLTQAHLQEHLAFANTHPGPSLTHNFRTHYASRLFSTLY